MTQRIISVGDDFALPEKVLVGDDNLPIRLSPDELSKLSPYVKVSDFQSLATPTDDSPAIIAAHTVAEQNNMDLYFEPNKEYKWSTAVPFSIRKSIIGNNAKIIIDESIGSGENAFRVNAINPAVQLSSATRTAIGTVTPQTLQIPALAGGGTQLIQLEDTTKQVAIRYGQATVTSERQFVQFIVDNRGYLLTDVSDTITGDYGYAYPIEDHLEIRDLHFHSINAPAGTDFTMRNMVIDRSNTALRNVTHTAEEGTAPSASHQGFFRLRICANITFENVKGHAYLGNPDGIGTYDINLYKVMGATFTGLSFQNFKYENSEIWGSMASSMVKDIVINGGSSLNRIDAHMMVENLTIKDSTIGAKGITVVGRGRLAVENCLALCQDLISLRKDYGSYWNGTINISNVKQKAVTTTPMSIVSVSAVTNVPFQLGFFGIAGAVNVNNHVFDFNNMVGVSRVINFAQSTASEYPAVHSRYLLPKQINIKNVSVVNKTSPRDGVFFMETTAAGHRYLGRQHANVISTLPAGHAKDSQLFTPNVRVTLDSVEFKRWDIADGRADSNSLFIGATGVTLGGSYPATDETPRWSVDIKNSNNVFVWMDALPIQVTTSNCVVAGVQCFPGSTLAHYKDIGSSVLPFINSNNRTLFNLSPANMYFIGTYFGLITKPLNGTFDEMAQTITEMIATYTFLSGIGSGNSAASIAQNAFMSSCRLSPDINLASIRTNLSDTNFVFGEWTPGKVFVLVKGLAANRPAAGSYPNQTYQATDTGVFSIWTGTIWARPSNVTPDPDHPGLYLIGV